MLLLAGGTSPAFAARTAIADGSAYAARINANVGGPNTLSAGPIAPAALACETKPATDQNSVASINLSPIITSSGTAVDTVSSKYGTNKLAVQSSSVIQGANVLGGAVTATTVQAVANSIESDGFATSNANGSIFVGLTVLGQQISGTPAPNTRVALPGLGVLILNEETISHDPAVATGITVNMIHVRITKTNSFGLPIGSNVIVGHAESSIAIPPVPVTLDANSYALLGTGLGQGVNAKSGPWAPARIPCTGGSAEDDLAQLTVAFGTLGSMTDTASGQITTNGSSAMAQSQIQNVDLLAGLIQAAAITASAGVTLDGVPTRSGSVSIVNGSIAGVPISSSPPPNTVVNVANLGYVVLNEQTGGIGPHSARITVNAMHIVVTMNNTFGLPIGASIVVAHASATARHF